jgi:hypothetical protein
MNALKTNPLLSYMPDLSERMKLRHLSKCEITASVTSETGLYDDWILCFSIANDTEVCWDLLIIKLYVLDTAGEYIASLQVRLIPESGVLPGQSRSFRVDFMVGEDYQLDLPHILSMGDVWLALGVKACSTTMGEFLQVTSPNPQNCNLPQGEGGRKIDVFQGTELVVGNCLNVLQCGLDFKHQPKTKGAPSSAEVSLSCVLSSHGAETISSVSFDLSLFSESGEHLLSLGRSEENGFQVESFEFCSIREKEHFDIELLEKVRLVRTTIRAAECKSVGFADCGRIPS